MKSVTILLLIIFSTNHVISQSTQPQIKYNGWYGFTGFNTNQFSQTVIGYRSPIISVFDTTFSGGTNIYEIDTIYQAADSIWIPDPGFYLQIPADTFYDTTNITNIGGTMVITGGDTLLIFLFGKDLSDAPSYIPPNVHQITIMQDTVRCHIAGLPVGHDTVLLSLYIAVEIEDDYKIELDTLFNMPYKSTFIDSLTGHSTLLDSADHLVHLTPGVYENRFYLRQIQSFPLQYVTDSIQVNGINSTPNGILETNNSKSIIHWNSKKQSIFIERKEASIALFEVYNMKGQLIQSQSIYEKKQYLLLSLKENGFYVIRVMDNDTYSTRRIYYSK